MMRSLRGLVAILGCSLLPAGCFLPSHPAGPSVGLRLEQGNLVLYLPLCQSEQVVSAQIDDPRGEGRTLWRGEQPAHPGTKEVRFEPSDWARQTGSFSYDGQTFAVSVDGTVRSYASGADGRKVLANLPAGSYDLNGKVATAAEIDQKSDCEKSG